MYCWIMRTLKELYFNGLQKGVKMYPMMGFYRKKSLGFCKAAGPIWFQAIRILAMNWKTRLVQVNLHTISVTKMHCFPSNSNLAGYICLSLQRIILPLKVFGFCWVSSVLRLSNQYLSTESLGSVFVNALQWLVSSNVCVRNCKTGYEYLR